MPSRWPTARITPPQPGYVPYRDGRDQGTHGQRPEHRVMGPDELPGRGPLRGRQESARGWGTCVVPRD